MRISELARRGDVPLATVKYYLREGLLPPGELTSSTQARYGEDHVARLRLVRALLGPGGLSIAQARVILGAIDEPRGDLFDALAVSQHALTDAAEEDPAAALELVARAGWRIDPSSPEVARLARTLAAMEDAGFEVPEGVMDAYLDAAARMAAAELDALPGERAAAVRYAVLGTILTEPLLLALRRLAQQDASARRLRRE